MNIYTLILLYMLMAYYVGLYTFDLSKLLVTPFDDSYLSKTLILYKISYTILVLIILFLMTIKKHFKKKSKKRKRKNIFMYIDIEIPYFLIGLVSLPIIIVFISIYIPAFQEHLNISKYYQDRLSEFVIYRPYYTLSINLLSTFMFIELVVLYRNKFKIKYLLKILFIGFILLLTGKRGQLFFPIFITGLSYLLYKRHYLRIFIFFSITIIVGSLLRLGNISDFQTIDFYESFSSSFFVSIREITRVLSFFNDEYLYGLTYIADVFSFIPTSINSFKEEYNYMRYITYLSGENPDLFGGMRATYIAEAYINFGYMGVAFVSSIFGFVLYYLQKFINYHTKYDTFEYYILLFGLFKLICMPFFENGSAMILFFIITIIGFKIVPFYKKLFFKRI